MDGGATAMNRRTFVGNLVAVAAALHIGRVRRYGYMDVDRWFSEGHHGKCVLFNGVDITDRCSEFDDVKGYAVCFVHDSEGRPFVSPISPDELAKEILTGRIEVVG